MELSFYATRPIKIYTVKKNGLLTYTCHYDIKQEKKTITDIDGNVLGCGKYIEPLKSVILKKNEYQICINDTKVKVNHKGGFKPYYATIYDGFEYIAILHWGHKISLYKNKIQIGYFITENKKTKNENWDMKIIANKDESDLFLTLLCLHVYSNFIGEGSDGSNPNFNIVFGSKKFDKNWSPKL
jgi:hypothetical protein